MTAQRAPGRRGAATMALLLIVACLTCCGVSAQWQSPDEDWSHPVELFSTAYDSVGPVQSVDRLWQAEQEPRTGADGAENPDRIRVSDIRELGPLQGAPPPSFRFALRVELRPFNSPAAPGAGDVTVTDGYAANRAEVYARHPPRSAEGVLGTGSDPVGAVRSYSFAVLVPRGHQFAQDERWLSIAQWKGVAGGPPPIALEVKRDSFRLGGDRQNRGMVTGGESIGAVEPGRWTYFDFRMKLSPDGDGWIEVLRDGGTVFPRTVLSTMDIDPTTGEPDPIYFKQGIYRSADWDVTQVIWFGPTTISEPARPDP